MFTYNYYDTVQEPYLDGIANDICSSGSILNDNIYIYARWDHADSHLIICFELELSSEERLTLDEIVEDNLLSGS